MFLDYLFGYKAEIVFSILLWPYSTWLNLYYLRKIAKGEKGFGTEIPQWVTVSPLVSVAFYLYALARTLDASLNEGIVWMTIAAVVVWVTRWRSAKTRSRLLGEWAKTVALSRSQRDALTNLWKAFKEKKVPNPDPLARISPVDKTYLLKITNPEYRPKAFGKNGAVWVRQHKDLVSMGYSDDQAKVLCGMILNRIGRSK
jgi:hypothetical protein